VTTSQVTKPGALLDLLLAQTEQNDQGQICHSNATSRGSRAQRGAFDCIIRTISLWRIKTLCKEQETGTAEEKEKAVELGGARASTGWDRKPAQTQAIPDRVRKRRQLGSAVNIYGSVALQKKPSTAVESPSLVLLRCRIRNVFIGRLGCYS
jgi:hypothetical protein